MESISKFGERLLKLREERNETQQQLADAIGITRQSLSRYETNDRTPNIDLVYNIAKHYNVSADYLLGLSEIQSSDKKIETACEVTGLSEKAINEIITFCSFTAEDDIIDRIYTKLDADFFVKHNISSIGIINDVVEKILPLICLNILEIFVTISEYCYDIEHTRSPLDQMIEYYDVFENCQTEEEKAARVEYLSKCKLADLDKINYTFELEKRIKHSIYDCADYFKFGLSDYISHVCKGIESFKYEGLLKQYKITAEYAREYYGFDMKEVPEHVEHNPEKK